MTVQTPVFSQVTDEDSYTGWLRPSEKVEVRARVRGHIKKVDFHDGDMVTKDQLLFELDPRPFQAQIDQALAQSKAIEAQKIALEKDVARYQLLIKSKAVSQQDLDKAIADVGYASAQIDARMEEVKSRQLDLEFSRITAPIAGKIGRAMLTEGNLVNAGGSDPVLTTIIAVDPIALYFSVDEPALQKFLKADQDARQKSGGAPDKRPLRERKLKIRFGLETDEGFPHEATLDFANNEIDSTTGTIEVRADVPNPDGLFAPGYRVRVSSSRRRSLRCDLVPEIGDQHRSGSKISPDRRWQGDRQTLRRAARPIAGRWHASRQQPEAATGQGHANHRRRNAARHASITPSSRFLSRRRRKRRHSFARHVSHIRGHSSSIVHHDFPFLHRPADFRHGALDRHRDRRRRGRASVCPSPSIPRSPRRSSRFRRPIPGANAKTVADIVAIPIEQEVNGVERMLYMSSRSTNDGQMLLDVTFEVGTNLDMAQVLVQNRVAIAEAKLPEEVKRLGVTTKKKSPAILMCVNIISPDGSYESTLLEQFRAP